MDLPRVADVEAVRPGARREDLRHHVDAAHLRRQPEQEGRIAVIGAPGWGAGRIDLRRAAAEREAPLCAAPVAVAGGQLGLSVVQVLVRDVEAEPDVVLRLDPVRVGRVLPLRVGAVVRHEVVVHTDDRETRDPETGPPSLEPARPIRARDAEDVGPDLLVKAALLDVGVHPGPAEVRIDDEFRCGHVVGANRRRVRASPSFARIAAVVGHVDAAQLVAEDLGVVHRVLQD